MPRELTLEGRGQLARMEDWLRIAAQAYVTEEWADYNAALELVVGIGQSLLAENRVLQHKAK